MDIIAHQKGSYVMSKKVGVVTITQGSNYGNKLQHYAVLQAVKTLGYEPETITDTTAQGFADPVNQISMGSKLKPSYLKASIHSRMQYKYHRKNESDGLLRCVMKEKKRRQEFITSKKVRQDKFNRFSEQYLELGPVSVSATTRLSQSALDEYDGFVCGSDQIWNPMYRDVSPVRFLQFAPRSKRIALAPSFGVSEIPESRKDLYAKMLAEIPFLSVREDTGRDMIANLTGREAPVLIDPTLTLDATQWDKIATKPNAFRDDPFLLTYYLGSKSKRHERAIRAIAQERGLRIVNLHEIAEREHYTFDPAEFLWLIKHASFICTDSFHGVVFSTIYEKDFFHFARYESGFGGDNRVATLLKKLELTACTYQDAPYIRPDFTRAKQLLAREQTKFFSFLKNALESSGIEQNAPVYTHVTQLNQKHPSNCTGCTLCVSVCPTHAITMKRNVEGFLYPIVDEALCVACGRCVDRCKGVDARISTAHPKAYACINSDEIVRKSSSSGGIFSVLAQKTIEEGGAVYGARFGSNWKLIHAVATNMDEVKPMMGSKYLQSDLGETFLDAKRRLEGGQKVLYTGTPCQIAGLKGFLGEEYLNLLTMDIICHGVPSQLALDVYLKDDKDQLQKVSFRDKSKGWSKYSMKLTYANRQAQKTLEKDSYLIAFLRNMNLRHSCYDCKFKTVNRCSDITIADFWGVKHVAPDLDDDKGISLVITQSDKGEATIAVNQDRMTIREVDIHQAIKGNGAMTHSVLLPQSRAVFYSMIEQDFEGAVRKLYPMTIKRRLAPMKQFLWNVRHQLLRGGK